MRMRGTEKELTISIRKSTPDSDHSCQSWWSPTQSYHRESALSTKSDLNMGVRSQRYQSEKMLDFTFQDQDTSSTQSTGQSYSKVSNVEENNLNSQRMFFTQSGYHITSAKQEGGQIQYPLVGGQNYNSSHLQADCPQSFAQLAVPYSDQFFNGVLSSYGPQTLVMGVMPARVALPLDFSSEPIYVNPKQYHGILRRRQHRAKLEAQNKLVKNRKPYLHESRHQHALKRARGTGGRFLNSKKVQPSKPTTSATNGQDLSGSIQLHLAPIRPGSQVYHRQENHRDGTSTTSCSDVTSTSTSDDFYHPLDFSFSSYPPRVGGNYI